MGKPRLEKTADKFIKWVGSPASLLVHTVFFAGAFMVNFLGVAMDQVLLMLTTAVSLEAIYLAIFIQMTVNRNSASLEEVEDDVDEIQKDVDEIQKDVDEIQKDVDELQEDVGEMSEEEKREEQDQAALQAIKNSMRNIMDDIAKIKSNKK
jgi:peptidoglycan hydrolase CwlO-like protein